DVARAEEADVLLQLACAAFVDLDRDHLALELCGLSARRRAEVERPLALACIDYQARELRAATLRPDPAGGESILVEAVDAVRARNVRRPAGWIAAHKTHDRLRRLVLRAHERQRVVLAEVSRPDVGDPVGIRMPERSFGERVDELAHALGETTKDGIRERDRSFEPRAANELDRLVHRRVRSDPLRISELVRAEAERGSHRRIELAHRTTPELLDRVVERAHALHGSVRDPLREPTVAP